MFEKAAGAPAASRLEELATTPPGPAVMAELQAYDPVSLSPYDRVLLLRAWERQASWVSARQQPVLVAVAGAEGDGDWGREEVAAALRLSLPTAHRRNEVARALARRLRGTATALEVGEISYWHAVVMCEETESLDELQSRCVEALVLPRAGRQTVSELRRAVRRAVIKVDPKAADSRFEKALLDRGVSAYPERDGMGMLAARLRADDAMTAHAILTTLAEHKEPGDERTLDQRRADILVEILHAAIDGCDAVRDVGAGRATAEPHGVDPDPAADDTRARRDARRGRRRPSDDGLPSRRRRRRAQANVTVDLATALGLADNAGDLEGYGPIPPALARLIAADAELRRCLTDPESGALLDRSPDTYTPNDDLAEFIRAVGRVCPQPSCEQSARRGDTHHIVTFRLGGKTVRTNLIRPCERHHIGTHEHGWTFGRQADGRLTATSPSGHVYDVEEQHHPRDG